MKREEQEPTFDETNPQDVLGPSAPKADADDGELEEAAATEGDQGQADEGDGSEPMDDNSTQDQKVSEQAGDVAEGEEGADKEPEAPTEPPEPEPAPVKLGTLPNGLEVTTANRAEFFPGFTDDQAKVFITQVNQSAYNQQRREEMQRELEELRQQQTQPPPEQPSEGQSEAFEVVRQFGATTKQRTEAYQPLVKEFTKSLPEQSDLRDFVNTYPDTMGMLAALFDDSLAFKNFAQNAQVQTQAEAWKGHVQGLYQKLVSKGDEFAPLTDPNHRLGFEEELQKIIPRQAIFQVLSQEGAAEWLEARYREYVARMVPQAPATPQPPPGPPQPPAVVTEDERRRAIDGGGGNASPSGGPRGGLPADIADVLRG